MRCSPGAVYVTGLNQSPAHLGVVLRLFSRKATTSRDFTSKCDYGRGDMRIELQISGGRSEVNEIIICFRYQELIANKFKNV